jgi:putative colanic acid biosynthesis acetyltransferase WcaF
MTIQRPMYQDLSRFVVEPGFRGRPGLVVLIWQLVQVTFFALSPQPLFGWRRILLRLFGAKVGKAVRIRPSARITYPWKVSLGDYCWVGDHVEIYSLGPIDIGAHTVVSHRSYICSASHDIRDIAFPQVVRPVVIGAEAWIATDCFIGRGVKIGRGAIVAARSTVLSDVAEGAVVAGAPAVFKKMRAPSGASQE